MADNIYKSNYNGEEIDALLRWVQSGVVTSEKLADGAVTKDKLSQDVFERIDVIDDIESYIGKDMKVIDDETDLDSLEDGVVFIEGGNVILGYSYGLLFQYSYLPSYKVQLFYPVHMNTDCIVGKRCCMGSTWLDWHWLGEVVQTTGQSEEVVMSQKAVTAEINAANEKLADFEGAIAEKKEISETLSPTWTTGYRYFKADKSLVKATSGLHTMIECSEGEIYDISMRTQSATAIQPIILSRKPVDDETFAYDTDIIIADNLSADMNPYELRLEITESCYLYINRKENTTSFPCTIKKTNINYDVKIGDGSVSNEKIAYGAVTLEKLDKEISDDLQNFKNIESEMFEKTELVETIYPEWVAGNRWFTAKKTLADSNSAWLYTVIQCSVGEIYDISMRANSATVVQPIILSRKPVDDETFDYDTDIIIADNLSSSTVNPYDVRLEITESCYLYINRNNSSAPCTVKKVSVKHNIKKDAIPTSYDAFVVYKPTINSSLFDAESGVYSDSIKKTATSYTITIDMSEIPSSDRLMLAYKIKPTFMDCEKINYNFVGDYYQNRNVRSFYNTDIEKEIVEYIPLENKSETKSALLLQLVFDSSKTLQGTSVCSAYTNGEATTYLTDDERIASFQIYDIRIIDFSKTKFGYEVSTNYEYQIENPFDDEIKVNEADYVKSERSIYGFGDSLMMAGTYRDRSWIKNLYVPGYKLNIDYDETNEGHISNKTAKSVYSIDSFAKEGFVNKIVKDEVSVGDDVTIFALGIHDYSQNTQGTGYCRLGEIGVKEEDGNYNWCTVAGAIETILKKVTKDANKRFLWVNVASNKYGLDTDDEYSLREENNLIEQACKNWGVTVSDVFGKMGMNPSNIGGKNIWDGGYTDGYKYDETGTLVSDDLYFVTSEIPVSDDNMYKTLWVSAGVNGCYLSCFDEDGNWLRNNKAGWNILAKGTKSIKYSVPKATSVEELTAITNSPDRGFVSIIEDAMTTDSVHLTEKSYKRYLKIVNDDLIKLLEQ